MASRVRTEFLAAAPTLVLFTLQRIVALIAVITIAGPNWLSGALLRYDAGWYLGIVRSGYQTYPRLDPSGAPLPTNLAFFPLFPLLASLLTRLTPIPAGWALLGVAWAAGLLAAWALFLLGRELAGPGAGMALALLWGASSQSVVLIMGYPEGLFVALTSLALVAVLRNRPLAAAVAAALAGLTRPTALPLVAVVGLWLLVAMVRKARDPGQATHSWKTLLPALLITPSGLAAYLGFIAIRTGSLLGYFQVQGDWGMRSGWPHAIFAQMARVVFPESGHPRVYVIYVPIILGYLLCWTLLAGWLLPPARRKYAWVAAYGLIASAFALTNQSYFQSVARHLMAVPVLLLPLLDLRTRRATVALAIVVATLASAWWGASLLAHGGFSP